MSTSYEAIIIGTGQAGPPLARRLCAAGRRVAIIERGLFGGTCVNTGCIPTKAMVASAYAARMTQRAAEYGVTLPGPVAVDMKRVKQRKDDIAGHSNRSVESGLRNLANCTVYQGHARFESPHEISVGAERLVADLIFINVGARAVIPRVPGLDQVPYLTNSSLMHLDSVPQHLMILGGSYVGLEFSQMFRRFGSEISVVEAGPRLIAREDEDISAAILDILEREGIRVYLNTKCTGAAKRGTQTVLHTVGAAREVTGSHLLVAIGRRPNTDDLGLEKAGLVADEKGYIQVDDRLRTNVPGIWALGDCNGKGGFTHTSYNDFEIVAANLLDNDPRKVSDRITTYALYIDPPLGRAGLTETQAKANGRKVLIGKRPMTKVGRAVEKGETLGFMKVLINAETQRIMGAAILGTGGDEAIQSILDVMYADRPYTTIQRAMHIHPTLTELIPTMLGELQPLN